MRTALCLLLAQSVLGYLRKGVEEEHNNPPPHRLLQEAKIVADRGRFGEQNFPLGLCEGDCDNDRDCQPGLVCLDRQSKTDSLGGCSGRINSRADICVPESGLTPVASPVRAPTPRPPVEPPVSPPVRAPRDVGVDTGDVFALKLYWQLGYFWQEERFERPWCMRCRNGCNAGNALAIFHCDDKPTQWTFVEYDAGQIAVKVANKNICIEVEPEFNIVTLGSCSASNKNQRFIAEEGDFNGRRFELTPITKRGWCVTQRHHPKNNEALKLERCASVRRYSDTSFWNKV